MSAVSPVLILAILTACAFEFINGFHDTANAVATVIYTRSLKPWIAVTLSGVLNFLGVLLGGTAVALGILKLLPAALLSVQDPAASLAMIFAILGSAIFWNLLTWYFGIPSSSSHTLIGAILGLGMAHSWLSGASLIAGINWEKAKEIGIALLFSPILGFVFALILSRVARLTFRDQKFHSAPEDASLSSYQGSTPPWSIRSLMILTSSGVSFAHGANDGQKGIGLLMMILVTLLPGSFALHVPQNTAAAQRLAQSTTHIADFLSRSPTLINMTQSSSKKLSESTVGFFSMTVEAAEKAERKGTIEVQPALIDRLSSLKSEILKIQSLSAEKKLQIRTSLLEAESTLNRIVREHPELKLTPEWRSVQSDLELLKQPVEYVPLWVLLTIALSIGLGTMIGWKRIAHTIGTKIGKTHLTYSQGAAAEIVAMSMIGMSSAFGVPVSTTHVLSSGVAGSMVAEGSGVQKSTVKKIFLAWVLTLPVSMALSGLLYFLLLKIFQ